jgi:hypothetical protein
MSLVAASETRHRSICRIDFICLIFDRSNSIRMATNQSKQSIVATCRRRRRHLHVLSMSIDNGRRCLFEVTLLLFMFVKQEETAQ